jgi:hypothetical protein
MREKRRNGRVTTETSVEDEIAHLRGLDLKGLRARWQSVFQRSAPGHLPRHPLFAIIAYRIQVDRFGDLDHETTQVLDRTDSKDTGTAAAPLPALPHLDHDWPRLRFQPAAGGAFHSGSPLIMLAGQASAFWD